MTDSTIAVNRKAYHEYTVLESLEAGIALMGSEIKSVRAGRVDLRDAYARIENGEAWLHNAHIARYDPATHFNHEPMRARRLLLHKKQIRELLRQTQEKGSTLVPLKLYLKKGIAKIELGVVRGKRQYDKRQDIAKREADREMGRALRRETAGMPR